MDEPLRIGVVNGECTNIGHMVSAVSIVMLSHALQYADHRGREVDVATLSHDCNA